jgi:hypothetical protein
LEDRVRPVPLRLFHLFNPFNHFIHRCFPKSEEISLESTKTASFIHDLIPLYLNFNGKHESLLSSTNHGRREQSNSAKTTRITNYKTAPRLDLFILMCSLKHRSNKLSRRLFHSQTRTIAYHQRLVHLSRRSQQAIHGAFSRSSEILSSDASSW